MKTTLGDILPARGAPRDAWRRSRDISPPDHPYGKDKSSRRACVGCVKRSNSGRARPGGVGAARSAACPNLAWVDALEPEVATLAYTLREALGIEFADRKS